MPFFSVAFVLAFLSGSQTALASVHGSCTAMEYLCDAMKCNTDVFKGLQKDPYGDCSAKFNKFTSCVRKTLSICGLSQSQIDVAMVRLNFKENELCMKGGMDITPMIPYGSCMYSFNSDANDCVRTFHQKFITDKSDPALCSEAAKSKQCLKNLVASQCTVSSEVQVALNVALSDYNPFCDTNRDPGATGNGRCYGVKALDNPLHSTSHSGNAASGGMKQALLFPFLLLLFFVKI